MRRYLWILIPFSLVVFGSACRPQISLTASRDRINRGEEERKYVQEALHRLEQEGEGG